MMKITDLKGEAYQKALREEYESEWDGENIGEKDIVDLSLMNGTEYDENGNFLSYGNKDLNEQKKQKKYISFPKGIGGCIVPLSSEDNPHEFGLYDTDGKELHTGYFSSLQHAEKMAKVEFPGNSFYVKDLDEEWYVLKALIYRRRIKELHPSFKISQIILDMSKMYYNRNPDDWYTYIPFTYKNHSWEYRETASKDWVAKQEPFLAKTCSEDKKKKSSRVFLGETVNTRER